MVAAVIVLYKPDRVALHRLMRSLQDQVDLVVVIDNTPSLELMPRAQLLPSGGTTPCHYVPLGRNMGIAAAQNTGIRHALDASASHVILFDQDSAPESEMVRTLLSAEAALLSQGLPVAAVGPVFIDSRTGAISPVVRYSFFGLRTIPVNLAASEAVEAHFLIASGCLIRDSALKAIGMMREDLFIDWVDNEWGLRARSMGMRCYVVPQARMEHRVGDGVVRVLGRNIHRHTEVRNYYLIRNAVYLMRARTMGLRWKLSFLPRLPLYLVIYPLLAEHKLRNFATLLGAVRDGLRGHLGSVERS